MANIKSDEMALLKAVSIKLDDNTTFIITLQYHTEKGDRSKSRYRWLGRICRTQDINNKIQEFKQNENKLNPWIWPNDPSWNGKILYTDSDCSHAAAWLRSKLNKAVDWDTGVKLLNGWDKKKDEYFTAKKYDTEDYVATDGNAISILDKAALLAHVGQNVYKEQVKKVKTTPPAGQPNETPAAQPTANGQPNETATAPEAPTAAVA